MIYLLPVTHDVQFDRHLLSHRLKAYLTRFVKEKKIDLICEEAGQEQIELSSIPLQVSADTSIDYLPCEPSKKEAKKLGVLPPNWHLTFGQEIACDLWEKGEISKETLKRMDRRLRQSNTIREKYWLGKIKGFKKRNIVFVLGAGHFAGDTSQIDRFYNKNVYGKGEVKLSDGFDNLLVKNGFQVEVLPRTFLNPKYR